MFTRVCFVTLLSLMLFGSFSQEVLSYQCVSTHPMWTAHGWRRCEPEDLTPSIELQAGVVSIDITSTLTVASVRQGELVFRVSIFSPNDSCKDYMISLEYQSRRSGRVKNLFYPTGECI
jgi:hypothetical protein